MTYEFSDDRRKDRGAIREAVSHAKRGGALSMRWLPPLDPSLRRGTRRGLLAVAALFAFNAALAFSEGRALLALLYAGLVLAAVGLRTWTTPERWPATESALRRWFGGGDKGGGA